MYSFFIGAIRGPGVRCVLVERMVQPNITEKDDQQILDGLETKSPSDDALEKPVTVVTIESDTLSEPVETSHAKFECFECHGKFSVLRSLRKHRARAHSGKIFKCESCCKQFKHRDNLKQHKMTHLLRSTKTKRKAHKKKKTDIICKKCNVKFTKPSSLRRHNIKHNE